MGLVLTGGSTMNTGELTLEALAKRLEELERRIAAPAPANDWRRVVGMFDDSEIMPRVIAEGQAIRQADRRTATEGDPE
jgi:hypothetical protein